VGISGAGVSGMATYDWNAGTGKNCGIMGWIWWGMGAFDQFMRRARIPRGCMRILRGVSVRGTGYV